MIWRTPTPPGQTTHPPKTKEICLWGKMKLGINRKREAHFRDANFFFALIPPPPPPTYVKEGFFRTRQAPTPRDATQDVVHIYPKIVHRHCAYMYIQHTACTLHQSFQHKQLIQPSFHATIIMGHESHTTGIVTH